MTKFTFGNSSLNLAHIGHPRLNQAPSAHGKNCAVNWSSNLPQPLKQQRAVALGEIAASHVCGLYVQQGWQTEQGRFKILRRRVTWVAPPRRQLLGWLGRSAAMKLNLSDHLLFLLLPQGAGPISAVFLFNYCDTNGINAQGSTCTSEHRQLEVEFVKHEELSVNSVTRLPTPETFLAPSEK